MAESAHQTVNDMMISKLPESILSHILSFLPTKNAVTTSILSKQWQYLWTCVPDLDINDSQIGRKDLSFEQIICKILLSRNELRIRKFRLLLWRNDCGYTQLSSWLCAAVERSLEELDLSVYIFFQRGWFELPCSLFSSQTLVILKLEGWITLKVPSSVQLPKLKVLLLKNISSYNDDNSFCNLMSGCPVLDELVIQRYRVDKLIRYEISSPTLTNLVIDYWDMDSSGFGFYAVTVKAPALKYLSLFESISGAYNLETSEYYVVEENVHIPAPIGLSIQWKDVMAMFYALCNVKQLRLGYSVMKCLNEHIEFIEIPKFQYLSELKVHNFLSFWGLLQELLCSCPHLKHFTIFKLYPCDDHSSEEPQCWKPLAVPNCLSLHLTTFKFQGFEALKVEMEFVRYILKHSKVLRDMSVSSFPRSDLKKMFGIVKKLSMFERGSTMCQFKFDKEEILP